MSSSSVMSQRLLKKHFWTALIGVFVMSLILIASYSHDKVISHVRSVTRLPAWGKTDDTALSKIIDALYKPSVLSITAQSFTDETGEVFHLTQEPTYTEPLGKRVLILDVDTRPMTDDGQVFSPGGLSWPNPDPMSAGLLSHYLFARIHGYDYQFVKTKQVKDWSNTWSKVPEIKNALMTHEFVVFLDQDAMFRYPAVPLEWLMNHWGHNKETRLMMAAEPDLPHNTNGHGILYANTGFVIAQNSTRTHDIIDAWMSCPEGIKYEDCKRYRYDWPHEQAALIGYVKQKEFTRPDDIRAVPCNEANGSPYTAKENGCRGALVRHLWTGGKGKQPGELIDHVMEYFLPALYKDYRESHDKPKFPGEEATLQVQDTA